MMPQSCPHYVHFFRQEAETSACTKNSVKVQAKRERISDCVFSAENDLILYFICRNIRQSLFRTDYPRFSEVVRLTAAEERGMTGGL